jgi:hypothetical protein
MRAQDGINNLSTVTAYLQEQAVPHQHPQKESNSECKMQKPRSVISIQAVARG